MTNTNASVVLTPPFFLDEHESAIGVIGTQIPLYFYQGGTANSYVPPNSPYFPRLVPTTPVAIFCQNASFFSSVKKLRCKNFEMDV